MWHFPTYLSIEHGLWRTLNYHLIIQYSSAALAGAVNYDIGFGFRMILRKHPTLSLLRVLYK